MNETTHEIVVESKYVTEFKTKNIYTKQIQNIQNGRKRNEIRIIL